MIHSDAYIALKGALTCLKVAREEGVSRSEMDDAEKSILVVAREVFIMDFIAHLRQPFLNREPNGDGTAFLSGLVAEGTYSKVTRAGNAREQMYKILDEAERLFGHNLGIFKDNLQTKLYDMYGIDYGHVQVNIVEEVSEEWSSFHERMTFELDEHWGAF